MRSKDIKIVSVAQCHTKDTKRGPLYTYYYLKSSLVLSSRQSQKTSSLGPPGEYPSPELEEEEDAFISEGSLSGGDGGAG